MQTSRLNKWLLTLVSLMTYIMLGAAQAERGKLISHQALTTLDKPSITHILDRTGLNANNPINTVSVYKINYETIDTQGQLVTASAQVAYPNISGPFSLLSYQHGTATQRYRVPSHLMYESGLFHAAYFAGVGDFFVVQPDYLGLGDNQGVHPYLQPHSLATATIDAIYAAKEFARQMKIPLYTPIALGGYSEGGLATLATLREIERHHRDLKVYKTAAGAGPYYFQETMDAVFAKPGPSATLFVAYFLYGMHVNQGAWPDLSEVFAPQYVSIIPKLFTGEYDFEPIMAALPASPQALLTPDFFEALLTGQVPAINQIAKQFLFNHWYPESPIALSGPSEDIDVPFFNAEMLFKAWQQKGVLVTLDNVGAMGHVEGKFKTVESQLKYLGQGTICHRH